MYDQIKLFFLFILLPLLSIAMPINNGDYWVCKTHDQANIEWAVKNTYQKIALNLAFNACKKQSEHPKSCTLADEDCEGFHFGVSTKPIWRCTALDKKAKAWQSNYFINKDDAVNTAKEYCKSASDIPETCYVNLVTCINIH